MSGSNDWHESLFGCFDDWNSCCYGYWCTPCLFGSNAKKINDHSCVGMCCLYSILASCYLCWLPHCMERQSFREKYDLKANPSCGDFLTTCCCSPCALCQEARELKALGSRAHMYKPSGEAVISQPSAFHQGAYPDNYRV